ncbi:hypothetical protein ON010_g15996 [Phytophthora cinnamomi]|nr:hypothetical protein ON010_g15996 [Phytophthora cinnamomi]
MLDEAVPTQAQPKMPFSALDPCCIRYNPSLQYDAEPTAPNIRGKEFGGDLYPFVRPIYAQEYPSVALSESPVGPSSCGDFVDSVQCTSEHPVVNRETVGPLLPRTSPAAKPSASIASTLNLASTTLRNDEDELPQPLDAGPSQQADPRVKLDNVAAATIRDQTTPTRRSTRHRKPTKRVVESRLQNKKLWMLRCCQLSLRGDVGSNGAKTSAAANRLPAASGHPQTSPRRGAVASTRTAGSDPPAERALRHDPCQMRGSAVAVRGAPGNQRRRLPGLLPL